jgi:hypothetical protein
MTIQRSTALRIIESLRSGSNLLEGASLFSAGRQTLFDSAEESLGELEISDGTFVRWLRGAPGQGKTHFFARLMEMGFRHDWVVSYVQVSAKEGGLHRFDQIYAAIIANCLTRQLVNDGNGKQEPGAHSGWNFILDDWYSGLRRLAGGPDSEVSSFLLRDVIEQAVIGLRRRYNLNASFAQALREYARAKADADEWYCSVLRDWFHGIDVHSIGGETRRRLRNAGVLEPVSRKNAKDMLRTLSSFLAYRGFGGFLLLVDEVENVLGQTQTNRRNAYTILRELIDNVNDRHGMTRTAFYIAATPDVFDSETGIAEHEALASRVLPPSPGLPPNPAGSVLDLGAFPFTAQDYRDIGDKIADLHDVAKDRPMDSSARSMLIGHLENLLRRNPHLSVRQWVKSAVTFLDQPHKH